jgi:hypothetical protein
MAAAALAEIAGRRFCDRDCMDDFERAEKARKLNGRME